MYEWLVKTIESRKGAPTEVKAAIGYAALLAKRDKNFRDLVRVADMIVIRGFDGPIGDPGYQTNAGELIDQAADLVPSNFVPPVMSVNLALKTKDANRMARAADRLFSLGWPGIDDQIRRDLSAQVMKLVKTLNEEGRVQDAKALEASVATSQQRDVYAVLTWQGESDLDLVVVEPVGATADYGNPRTVFGGALIKNGYGDHPEEIYVCPRGFDGPYKFEVKPIYIDESKPIDQATLEIIIHEGAASEKRVKQTIDLHALKAVTVDLKQGRRKEVLPFIAPVEARPEVSKPPANSVKPSTKDKKIDRDRLIPIR